ncbi:MAG: type II toxin-antitoxin system HicB family antitoxin [Nanoarchaeota archaeon]
MVTFNVIVEKDEDEMFVSEVIGLSRCHTHGKTLDELMERTKEAISLYLKCKKVDIKDLELDNSKFFPSLFN